MTPKAGPAKARPAKARLAIAGPDPAETNPFSHLTDSRDIYRTLAGLELKAADALDILRESLAEDVGAIEAEIGLTGPLGEEAVAVGEDEPPPATKAKPAKAGPGKTGTDKGEPEPDEANPFDHLTDSRDIYRIMANLKLKATVALDILRESMAEDVEVVKRAIDLTDPLVGEVSEAEPVPGPGTVPGAGPAKPAAVAKPRRKPSKLEESPASGLSLAGRVWAAADEHKVISPVLLDLTGLSSITDYFYVAHAETPRQIKAIAEKISQRVKEAGVKPLGLEGLNQPDASWILIDLGEVIAHLFLPESRAKYDLESFWADAPRVDPKRLKKPSRATKKPTGAKKSGEAGD
ncbi:MAG: ribosome silencing factor [Deltaproteobacteria bacterium]|nr:ribosome silencing factor [Deltaproteobacteria bacterium]